MLVKRFFLPLICLLFSLQVQATERLTIAMIPAEDSRAMLAQSAPLFDALAEKLGVQVKGYVAADYNGAIEALRAGHVDLAYLGPFSYVKAAELAEVEAFVVAKKSDSPDTGYKSQIIVQADSEIFTIEDLKGTNFAFVAPTSTSGYMFPMAKLKESGLEPRQFFKNAVYSGSHDASILAVKHGRVEAAAVADRILQSALSKGLVAENDIRVIWSSDAIPESPMVWRRDLPEKTRVRIKEAFLSLRGVRFGDQGLVNSFEPTEDSAYDAVREVYRSSKG